MASMEDMEANERCVKKGKNLSKDFKGWLVWSIGALVHCHISLGNKCLATS